MTIELVCEECGTVLHAPDGAAGKVGRCRECGRQIRVPTPDEAEQAQAREFDPRYAFRGRDAWREAVRGPARGFWADAAYGFVLCRKPVNLIPLVLLCILLALDYLLRWSLLGMIGRFVVWGWIFAYCHSVILETASGEDELPKFAMENGWWDDIIVPFFQFLGSWLGVLLPAMVLGVLYLLYPYEALWYAAVAAFWIGVFIWPAAVLMVVIGGVREAFHLDLVVSTIVRSFPAYLVTLALLGLAFGPEILFSMYVRQRAAEGLSLLDMIVFAAAVKVFVAYAILVSMWSLGLYYRHFKSRFPWAAE